MDVVSEDVDLFEQISTREDIAALRGYMEQVLDQREKEVLTLRYGLSGATPLPQREVALQCGISRSYVSRRHYCKRGRKIRNYNIFIECNNCLSSNILT